MLNDVGRSWWAQPGPDSGNNSCLYESLLHLNELENLLYATKNDFPSKYSLLENLKADLFKLWIIAAK